MTLTHLNVIPLQHDSTEGHTWQRGAAYARYETAAYRQYILSESGCAWLQVRTLRGTQAAKRAWQAGSRRAGHTV